MNEKSSDEIIECFEKIPRYVAKLLERKNTLEQVNTPSAKAEGLSRLRGLRSWPYPLYGEGI